jgi:hypothetical protein
VLYVLDQNYFRSDELTALIENDPKSKFVIPDVALLEMCKGDRWRETMAQSLSHLSVIPGRVFHSMSVGEGLNFELSTGKSVECHLLPENFRSFLRGAILDLAGQGSGRTIELLRSKILSAQNEIRDEELNHERNREGLLRRVRIVEDALAGEPIRNLRAGRICREDKLSYVRKIAFDLCLEVLVRHGFSKNKAVMFLKMQPLTLRFFYLSVRHAVEWASKGGIDSMPPDRITNDLLDQDYLLIGSFFNRLLSKEKRVQEADVDLRELLRNG